MTEVKLGDQGSSVEILQLLLNTYMTPSPNLLENGVFDQGTKKAVLKFQKAKGLEANGLVGSRTWMALGLDAVGRAMPAFSSVYPWMRVAHAELLVHENSLPGQHNDRILEYHRTTSLKATTDETAWCSSFVNWVMKKAGYTPTYSAAAKSWLDWGIPLDGAREGAITIVQRKSASGGGAAGTPSGFHVGFLVSDSTGSLRLLGGNQSNQVRYSDFSLGSWEVKRYRWP